MVGARGTQRPCDEEQRVVANCVRLKPILEARAVAVLGRGPRLAIVADLEIRKRLDPPALHARSDFGNAVDAATGKSQIAADIFPATAAKQLERARNAVASGRQAPKYTIAQIVCRSTSDPKSRLGLKATNHLIVIVRF